jgi:hypothetical protein
LNDTTRYTIATLVMVTTAAIIWEATRAWWHARQGNTAVAAEAEDRAAFYAKQYQALPEMSHKYSYR